MNLKLNDDYFFLKTDEEIKEPYLRKSKGGYRFYWHFIRDFNRKYPVTLSDEDRERLTEKVTQIKGAKKLLLERSKNHDMYASFFDNGYKQYMYQAQAVDFITQQKKVLVADDVGLGKTIIGLTFILNLIENYDKMKFHIVVPASLRLQWLSEIRKFINRDMFPDLQIMVNNKTSRERSFLYKSFNESDVPVILISSYDILRRDQKNFSKMNPDAVLGDEMTKIKSRTTKINKAMRKIYLDTEYKVAMTATPIENGLQDLYAICEFLDKRKLHTKKYFESRYCILKKQRLWHRKIDIWKVVGYRNLKDAREKLSGLYIRRTVKDVEIELPDIIKQNIILELSDIERRLYKEISGDIYTSMSRDDILAKMIYLQQVCNSCELIDPKKKKSSKTTEIKRLLEEELKYSKVIMITRFKKYAEVLKRELKKYDPIMITGSVSMEQRQNTIHTFNNSEKHNLIIGTGAIEEGLNLQVASILVNIDLPWNPAKLHQRLGRLRRLGSEHECIRMINLITEDTIEERVLNALYDKGVLFERMFKRDETVKIGSLLSMKKDELIEILQ